MKINNITCSESNNQIFIQIICMVLFIPTKIIGMHAATCDRVVLVYIHCCVVMTSILKSTCQQKPKVITSSPHFLKTFQECLVSSHYGSIPPSPSQVTTQYARFLKVCRYDQLRRNSCYNELGRNSIGLIVSSKLVVKLRPTLS